MSKVKKMDAKAVTAWVKSRWALVAFVVIAALLVPAMVYFAMGWQASKHDAFAKQVDADAKDFVATSLNYKLPGLLSGDAGVQYAHAPNEVVTNRFKTALDSQQASAAGLVNDAVKHNKGVRAPLVPGVFPNPDANDLTKAKQFRRVYVNEAARALLALINAKDPISLADLGQRLKEHQANFLQRELGTDANAANAMERLSEEKRRTLEKELLAERENAYIQWGQKLNVYAGMNIFVLPPVVETETPTSIQLWDWQVQYWTMHDVMQAVADANASARDQGVTKSVVKRIERLTVDPVVTAQQPGAANPGDPAAAVPPPADGAPDYTKSITGRKSGGLYDVVTANLTCVVATKDLPRFFDAVSKANLMTVTRAKITKVDLTADLKDGYFYGPDGVSRVDMTIEAIWLREWTKELMPKEVKVALGLESGDPAAAPGATPPAPVPTGPAPTGRRAGSVGG